MRSVIRKFGSVLPEIIFPLRSDGKVDVCPVDAFAGATFNINEFGHIKSDVSALMEAQSKSEQDLISQRLVELQGQNPDLSGLSDADKFKFSMSRYYQTPAEVQAFGESLARAQYERDERLAKEADLKARDAAFKKKHDDAFAAYQKAVADGKIDANGNPVNPVNHVDSVKAD